MSPRRNPSYLNANDRSHTPLHLPVSAVGLSYLGRRLAVGLQMMQEPIIKTSGKMVTWVELNWKLTRPAFLHSLLIEVGIGLLSPNGMMAGGRRVMIKGGGRVDGLTG